MMKELPRKLRRDLISSVMATYHLRTAISTVRMPLKFSEKFCC